LDYIITISLNESPTNKSDNQANDQLRRVVSGQLLKHPNANLKNFKTYSINTLEVLKQLPSEPWSREALRSAA
jgi:hypothetical protein